MEFLSNAASTPAKRVEVIGNATLYLGDCFAVAAALEQVSHVVSDPPYEKSTHDNIGGIKRNDGGKVSERLNFAPVDEIRAQIVEVFGEKCLGWFLAFCTTEGVGRWADSINESPLKYKRACVWVKPDAMPQMNGQGPANGAECFVTAWSGRGHARWNSGGKRGVYTHCVNGPARHGVHPTEKPVSLMSEILLDFTSAGETVLDPFMGSGTTGVACAKLGRKFIGIEMNETYFDIACERIAKAVAQPDMFVAPPPKAVQTSLLDMVAPSEAKH